MGNLCAQCVLNLCGSMANVSHSISRPWIEDRFLCGSYYVFVTSQDTRMCAALLFYAPHYSQECLKLEEEHAPLKLQSGKTKADMRKQLHAMHDMTIKLHWVSAKRVFSRYTKRTEHNLRAAGIYRVATEMCVLFFIFVFVFLSSL